MADKKGKHTKNMHRDQQKDPQIISEKKSLSGVFLDEIKWAFTAFDALAQSERLRLFGDQKYLDQFWEYFKIEYPNLLDKIDKKDLPVYIQTLENKWFSIGHIVDKAGILHDAFTTEDTEIHVMEQSLQQLQSFCADDINAIPEGTFKKFADVAGFTHDKLVISSDGKLKNIDALLDIWTKFIEKEWITLGKTATTQIEHILTPPYNPTERMMVTVAITKIRKQLTWKLKADFDAQFTLPITIFTSYQDLLGFRDQWSQFLYDHSAEIDKTLAKKLDAIIVTNGDIYREILKSGRTFDATKWFSEQEQYFRRIFNNLVTRQLFEEVEKTQKSIDHYIESIGTTFKQFPPYVDQILTIYPFNTKIVDAIDPSFSTEIQTIDVQMVALQQQYSSASDEEKSSLRMKMKLIKQQREYRRWQAYILFLRTQDAPLADVFAQLVASTFDFSVLSPDQQQIMVNVLVKHTFEDTIKNKIPELLSVDKADMTQFVDDFFDLKKKDIVIPTKHWPISLSFLKKEFLSSTRKQLPWIHDLEDIGQLPLNFLTQLTESNATFFEDSHIFHSIYTDFKAKNGNFRLNDAYKVRIKKDGKMVEWYLSAYSPIEENNNQEYTGKELYLYSHPISAPNQERKLVTRPHEEGKIAVPVVIKDEEQQLCDIDILDKKINLNGEAMWALLFGYVLGQQSMNMTITPQQEKKLAEQFDALAVYQEKEMWEEESVEPIVKTKESSKEISEIKTFDADRKQLLWDSQAWFLVWTRLFMPFADSGVPPIENGKSWLQMEIVAIDDKKGTFTVKIHGGELDLGKSEWATKELPIHKNAIDSIKKAFGEKIYKVPNIAGVWFEQQMNNMNWYISGLDKYFGSVKMDSSRLKYSLWNYAGKEITHFGIYQPKAIGEDVATDTGKLILYAIKCNANGTITVSGDSTAGNQAKHFPTRDMDYATFMLFIKDKWLQPKCSEQLQDIRTHVTENNEVATTKHWFSINSVFGFFKNSINKIKDGVKKYDEERTEDLTDILTNQGQLWGKIWWFLSPFSKISSSFETMWVEYFMERDNRIWKKVEKRTKIYDDFDYSRLYADLIWPMLRWEKKIVPHYKIAAMLLIHLKKWKGPYAKNLSTSEGSRVGQLLGQDHQKRYLAIREKKIRDLEENAHIYGGPWADQIKNELVELEMRYIVHIMDGRHMGVQDGDKTKLYFQGKYSKKFCDELEWAYTSFYKQDGVDEWFTKNKDVNFEFARNEYFRQLADRPQQALPFLKVMATKAINDTQWQVFETAVLAWILSWVFLNMTYSSTQSFIQTICRTRGFVPWIFAKDIHQQSKMQRLLDLFSGGEFTKKTWYNPANYSFTLNTGPSDFINKFIERTNAWNTRYLLSKFLDLEWKNVDNKTLLDLHADPKTSLSDKFLLKEYIERTNEKNEKLDEDVLKNTSSLTGSILTKSQSVVDQMIKIDENGFHGENWDAKEDMKKFSEKMEEAIPKGKLDVQKTKFFLDKFVNRFGERFSWSKKTELLKRLKWCNEHPTSPEVDDILHYSIVGEIVLSLSSRSTILPDELLWALEAWKSFFKNNLNTILDDNVISVFGNQAQADLVKYSPKLEPWENAAALLDREDSPMFTYWLSTEQKKIAADTRNRIKGHNYINKELYKLAEDLSRKCPSISNRFKRDVAEHKKSLIQGKPSIKATWAKIKNPETVEQVKRILENKPLEEDNPDEFLYQNAQDYDDYDYPYPMTG